MKSVSHFNKVLQENGSPLLFTEDDSEAFNLRMAKKKNGKPSTDYPSKKIHFNKVHRGRPKQKHLRFGFYTVLHRLHTLGFDQHPCEQHLINFLKKAWNIKRLTLCNPVGYPVLRVHVPKHAFLRCLPPWNHKSKYANNPGGGCREVTSHKLEQLTVGLLCGWVHYILMNIHLSMSYISINSHY